MYFDLQRYWRLGVFLVPSMALVVHTCPSYGEVNAPSSLLGVKSNQGEILSICPSLTSEPVNWTNREVKGTKSCVKNSKNLEVAQETQTPPDSPKDTSNTTQIQVKKVELINSSFARSRQIQELIKPLEGKTVSLQELIDVADKITNWYFEQGYITSRAVIDVSEIKDGVVPIRVIEGSVEEIKIDPPPRKIRAGYIRSRIAQGLTKPFSQSKLEEQLRLLQTDPLFSKVEGSVRPGTKEGQSVVIVRVTEADPIEGFIGIDNYSPPSVGSERIGISGIYRNVTGIGDQFAASYYFSTLNGGSRLYDFNYQLPVNAMNGTLQLRTSISQVKVVQDEFKTLDIRGESLLYEFTYRQPLIRSLREEFAVSLGFTVQDGQTFTFAGPTPFGIGPDLDGNSRTRTLKFAQDYVRRDGGGAWGLRSQFNFGLDVFDPTINTDPTIPDARYFSWLLQLQRQQRLGSDSTLLAQAELQLSPDGLLPSQQFVIGGAQSVRGYRQNTRAGDNGFRFSLENRLTVVRDTQGKELVQFAPFFDMGYIWNKEDNPNNNALQKERFLAGLGMGLLWRPLPDVNVRVDYARPLVEIEDKQNNAQDEGLYFSVGYQF